MSANPDLLKAVIAKAEAADDYLLLAMLEAEISRTTDINDIAHGPVQRGSKGFQYSEQQLAELNEEAEAYRLGKGKTYSREEFWSVIQEKTGYQRRNNEA